MSLKFGAARQIGFVVRDFEGAMRQFVESMGIGPFLFFKDAEIVDYRFRGVEAEAPVLSIAFAYSGDLQIEVIHQQNEAPSCYREFLNSGREGLHHVSGFCDRIQFDAKYRAAGESGYSAIHEGSIGNVRFAYFPADGFGVPAFWEISEADMDSPRALFSAIHASAASWDGSDPYRPIELATA